MKTAFKPTSWFKFSIQCSMTIHLILVIKTKHGWANKLSDKWVKHFYKRTIMFTFHLNDLKCTGCPRYLQDFLSANSRFAVQNDGTYLPRISRETCMGRLINLLEESWNFSNLQTTLHFHFCRLECTQCNLEESKIPIFFPNSTTEFQHFYSTRKNFFG